MKSYHLSELAEHLKGELKGKPSVLISGLSTLQHAKEGDLSFLANPAYAKYLESTQATAVIVAPAYRDAVANAIVLDNPYLGYARISQLFDKYSDFQENLASTAVISRDACLGKQVYIGEGVVIESGVSIGDRAYIGAGCYIGQDSQIGDDTRLYPKVSVYHGVSIGDRCIIHSGVVIGSDGFGFAPHSAGWEKIAQLGGVVLGNDVEVGANTTIDRGALDDTRIGNGVKLDNQIQIAHNVVIGDHSVLAAATAVAGSTTIGSQCVFGGACAIAGHLQIADQVQITGMSMITKSLTEAGVYSSGLPAQANTDWRKSIAHIRRLDGLVKRVKKLEKNTGN
jgi:UDP-3-O-[3-hydroxymyristoyl] glucosamine N-acyltransferase